MTTEQTNATEATRRDASALQREVRPLAECSRDDLVNNHALVYGRCKIWYHGLKDSSAMEFHWSKHAWWKAMWYSHRGPPSFTENWGVYGGHEGFTGPGDAELTHFIRMPEAPAA